MEYFKIICKVIFIGLIVFLFSKFFYQIGVVNGSSMEPTLYDKNIVIIKKYNLNPDYNDIVVIRKNNKTFIKRIVGKPNDNILIDNYIYVNNNKVDEKMIKDKGVNYNLHLNEDEFYCLGDNRDNSIDSRFSEIGIIYRNQIIGKVLNK